MTFYNRVMHLCKINNIPVAHLEEKLGYGNGAVARWKTGTVPKLTKLAPLAAFFSVSLDYLLGASDIPYTADRLVEDPALIGLCKGSAAAARPLSMLAVRIAESFDELGKDGQHMVRVVLDEELRRMEQKAHENDKIIPIIATSFAAGVGDYDPENPTETVIVPATSLADFAIRISGDSMEPILADHSLAYGINKTPHDGEIAALVVNGNLYVKQIYHNDNGFCLKSINRNRADMDVYFSNDSEPYVHIFGTIIPQDRA